MPANIGSQIITLKFFDPVDSYIVNRMAKEVRQLGVYSGGYLTKISDISVSLSTLICEIGDGTYQVRGETQSAVTEAVTVATPYVVLRWTYTGSATVDYMDFLAVAVGDILANDVVVGKCVFAGATLTGFDYTARTNPHVMDLYLKAEVTSPASMRVIVRSGRVNYGTSSIAVPTQQSPLFVAPGSLSRIDLVQIDTSGLVIVTQGSVAASPVPPSYAGLVTLAEVTLAAGQTSILATNVLDVRSFVATGSDAGGGALVPQNGIIMWSGTIASIQTGWQLCDGTNGTPDLRNRFVVCADADHAGIAKSTITGSPLVTHNGLMPAHKHRGCGEDPGIGNTYGNDGSNWHRGLGGGDNNNSLWYSETIGTGVYNVAKFYALAYIMKL